MTTNVARLITAAMDEQNLTQGVVERRGGPKKQSLSYLLTKWTGTRSLGPDTIDQLSRALGISRRSLGRAAAVDMGLLPPDEARADALALLTDALREQASDQDRELVVAAARAVWQVLKDRTDIVAVPHHGGERSAEEQEEFERSVSMAALEREHDLDTTEGHEPTTRSAKRPTRRLR